MFPDNYSTNPTGLHDDLSADRPDKVNLRLSPRVHCLWNTRPQQVGFCVLFHRITCHVCDDSSDLRIVWKKSASTFYGGHKTSKLTDGFNAPVRVPVQPFFFLAAQPDRCQREWYLYLYRLCGPCRLNDCRRRLLMGRAAIHLVHLSTQWLGTVLGPDRLMFIQNSPLRLALRTENDSINART